MERFVILLFISFCFVYGNCRLFIPGQNYSYYEKSSPSNAVEDDVDPGTPLILTPLIESNKLAEAKSSSRVTHPEFFDVVSYSGFFTVDKIYNSNLFFWFFPAEQDYANAPIIVWLQGGPGDASLTGLFIENGPFKIVSATKIELRDERWTKDISMLYIDNPVGTAYSFTERGGYCKNQTIIGKHLYEALTQFFQVFPELQKNNLFIAGESYGGKYAPSLAYTIHQNNPTSAIKMNLEGLALTSGFSDPVNMLNYADYLYQTGLIDLKLRQGFTEIQNQIINHIGKSEWKLGYEKLEVILGTLVNKTGLTQMYNYLNIDDPTLPLVFSYMKYVQRNEIRSAIHVGSRNYNPPYGNPVYNNLQEDFLKSVAPWISELLNNYGVLTYNGQLDIIVAYPLTENYLHNLQFNGDQKYKTAARDKWVVDNEVAGYVKTAEKLTEVLVRKGGHILVHDQPKWCYDLISKFVKNQNIASLE